MAGHEKGKVTPPTKPKTAYFDGDIFDRLIDSKLLFRKIMSSRNAGKDADLQNFIVTSRIISSNLLISRYLQTHIF